MHGFYGMYHKTNVKYPVRCGNEFAWRHSIRSLDTIRQISLVAFRMRGKRLHCKDLTADNGLSSCTRYFRADREVPTETLYRSDDEGGNARCFFR